MPGSENIEVKQSGISGAGHGLFALKDFQPGDVVLAIDRPLVAELDMERLRDTCAWCFQRGATDPQERAMSAAMGLPAGFIEVKACTGCRRISYCSKKCQTKAWKSEHKYECKILAPSERPDLPEAVRAAIKLLGRLRAGAIKGEGTKGDDLKYILNFRPYAGGQGLDEFSRQNTKQLIDDFNMLGWAAWKYSNDPSLENEAISKGFVFNVLCNKFRLASPLDDTGLGLGFDPLICTANHSCEPNVNLVFNQPATVFRALTRIKKGDEIFMKYVDVTNPFSVRQEELKEAYYFNCQCPKCKKGAHSMEDTFSKPASELSAEHRKLADNLVKRHGNELSKFSTPANDETDRRRLAALQAEAFSVSGTLTDRRQPGVGEIRDALKICIESGLWSWTRQPVPHLCKQLFGMYIATGDPYQSFRLGLKMYFEIMPNVYPPKFSSDQLVHVWAMTTVTNVLCGPANREVYEELLKSEVDLRIAYYGFLFEVYDNISKMFGLDSPFGRVVESTYKQIMAGTKIHESEIRDRVKALWPLLETVGRSANVLSAPEVRAGN
ncbi:MYND finger [Seiridium cupressi]